MEKENKQTKSIEVDYSIGQMDAVYRTMLQPIKLSISQILLYDTETACKFLNEYNEIIQSEDLNIFNRIVELEMQIESYQKGKENKTYDSKQVQSIIQSINELKAKDYQLSAKELLEAFANIKIKYKDLGIHNFKTRENVENKFYELQVKVIERALKEIPEVSLSKLIKDEDISGLQIAINGILSQYLQSDDLKEKNKAQKIVNMLAEDRAIYSDVVWQLIDELETGLHKSEAREKLEQQDSNKSTALTVRKQGTNLSLLEKVGRKFSINPKLPLLLGDLRKINIDWLTEYIPQEMLIKLEKVRLSTEGRKTDKIFLPDKKTPIYDMIEKTIEKRRILCETTKNTDCFSFVDKTDGEEKELAIKMDYFTKITIRYGDGSKTVVDEDINGAWLASMVIYAEFIDNLFGTNWKNEYLNEIAEPCMNSSRKVHLGFGRVFMALNKGYKKLYNSYEKEQLDFKGTETAKRKRFYEKNDFKEGIKTSRDMQMANQLQTGRQKYLGEREQ